MALTEAQTVKLHTVARRIVTCNACQTRYLFVGTLYARNGLFCTCLTNGVSALTDWVAFCRDYGRGVSTTTKAVTVNGTRTSTECGDECKSAKSARCACTCAGANHGAHLGLAF